jgi:hypothetical protein
MNCLTVAIANLPHVALLPNLWRHNQTRTVELRGDDLTLSTIGGPGRSASRLHSTRITPTGN